jgi:large subunit ribosomal protein L10
MGKALLFPFLNLLSKRSLTGPFAVSYGHIHAKQITMAITKAKKEDIVAKATAALKDAVSVVFVRFNKISVADTSAMRKSLREEGVGYMVAKKTLLKRALETAGYEGTLPELPGEVAMAYSTGDATAAARGLYGFGKKFEGLSLLGGVFEGTYLDAAGITAIATIPPVPVLRGMFVNVINSPIQRFAIAMSEVAKTKTA